MGVFQVDIQTDYYGEFISNRYFVDEPGLAEAAAIGVAIANLHAKLLPPSVKIDAIRASTPAPADNQFFTSPVNIPGTRAATSQTMPEFCRYRVDFQIGYRRPLRKFLLVPFEEDSEGSSFTGGAVARVINDYINPLIALASVCSAEGLPVINGSLNARIGMRQLRRGSKRRLQPII
jgi:hypothetical protein